MACKASSDMRYLLGVASSSSESAGKAESISVTNKGTCFSRSTRSLCLTGFSGVLISGGGRLTCCSTLGSTFTR